MANLLTIFGKHLQKQNTQQLTFIRSLSSFNNNNNRTKSGIVSILQSNDDLNVWSESNWTDIGKLLNKSIDFPLPGQTGPASPHRGTQQLQQQQRKQLENSNNKANKSIGYLGYSAVGEVEEEHQDPHTLGGLRQAASGVYFDAQSFLDTTTNTMNNNETPELNNSTAKMATPAKTNFELKAYPCPVSLLKDFENYFRSRLVDDLTSSQSTATAGGSVQGSGLTLITVSFKSGQDMATWSLDVENERERLIDEFVDTAQQLCAVLEKEGYWADFIDPSSGRPYKSPYTHATFWETDERYQQLGFEILDHGCCKTISHHKWGTKTYVGSLLTSASASAKIVQELQDKLISASASNANISTSTTNLD